MSTVLRYFARAPRGIDTYLQQEIKTITGTNPKYCEHMRAFEFHTDFKGVLKLAFQCRTIESLKVQVGQKFQARDQKQLLMRLKSIPFHSFWDISPNNIPDLRVAVNHSMLIPTHARRVFEDYMYHLPVNREYRRIEMNAAGLAKLSEVERILAARLEQKLQQRSKAQNAQKLLTQNKKQLQVPNRTGRHVVRKEKPQNTEIQENSFENRSLVFDLDIDKNYGRIYTPVNVLPMYKHGWKKRVGWAPIKENIAACMILASGLLKNGSQELKLWDPFCGSSTILLQALSMATGGTIRQDHKNWFNFAKWPCLKNQIDLIEEMVQNNNNNQRPKKKIKILGSDISLQAINYSIQNFRSSGIVEYFKQNTLSSSFLRKSPRHQIYSILENSIELVAEDFETTGKHILTEAGFNIITNIPYIGHRSSEKMPQNQIISVYKRFADFISTNIQVLSQVMVVMPIPEKYDPYHFLSISKTLSWDLLETYDSGGPNVGLYRLCKQKSGARYIDKFQYHNQHSLERLAQEQNMLINPNDKSTQIAVRSLAQVPEETPRELPKYLIPKRPKRNMKKLREWKRKVSALRISFEKHEKLRIYHNKIKGFLKEKMMKKLAQRGAHWRAKNINVLGKGKLMEYQQQIRKLFEAKIEKAIQRDHELRENKLKKKNKNKGVAVQNKRKW